MSQKVIIQNCRLSYPALFKPKAGANGGAEKYGCTIIIPKTDTTTLASINSAIQAEYADAAKPTGQWKGLTPPNPTITLYDGDTTQPSGQPWGPECKGCMVLRTTSGSKPDVVDEYLNPAMDATKFYAGCYCHFSVNFGAYDQAGNKGIGAYLNCVMFVRDGEPLEAHASAKDDFAGLAATAPVAPAAPSFGGFPGAMPSAPATPAAPAAPSFGGFPGAAPAAPAMPAQPPVAAPQTSMPAGFGGMYGLPQQ